MGVILCAAIVMLSCLSASWWIGDLLANLRLQWLMSAVTCAAVLMVMKDRHWAIAACLIVIATLPPIWLGQTMVAPACDAGDQVSRPLRVAAFNVLSTNTHHSALIDQIRRADADVLLIVELSTPLAEQIQQQLLTEYPYSIEQPQDRGNFGIGLYSRIPLQDGRVFRLSASQVASVEATIRHDSQTYLVYGTHPVPPLPATGFHNRNEHLRELATKITDDRAELRPSGVIVMGDLNLTPWSPVFRQFCHAAGLLRCSRSMRPTWYARPVFPCGLVLDHILISGEVGCCEYAVFEAAGSDHRLICAELRPRGGRQATAR